MNVIGLSGKAKSGKDTAADILVREYGYIKVAFADEMKRMVWRLWPELGYPDLWGPSEKRSVVRDRLIKLGDWGREADGDVWVRYLLETVRALGTGTYDYRDRLGLTRRTRGAYQRVRVAVPGVVVPDVRFLNELSAVHSLGGVVWRVWRPGSGLTDVQHAAHRSETELGDDDRCYDRVLVNDGDLEELASQIAAGMK